MAKLHHAVQLGLNACGVECCPHASYRRLVAVASYLHLPGNDDTPQSRVGQLFLYNLAPFRSGLLGGDAGDGDSGGGAEGEGGDDDGGDNNGGGGGEEGGLGSGGAPTAAGWSFAPAAPALDTQAIFELRWAPAAYNTSTGPVLAQADAGGCLTLYAVDANPDDDAADLGSQSAALREIAKLECGGGGLGMTTCVDWNPSSAPGGGGGGGCSGDADVGDECGGGGGLCDLAVCGADGGIRAVALRECGAMKVTCATATAHDLEAWAVAFAHPDCAASSHPGALLFSGADDAAFKGWDLRAGLGHPVFVNRRAHAAGVTCVAPSPHNPHAVATGSYDDRLRLWDVRQMARPVETAAANCGGGVWRCRWHPTRRRLACAAMDGGAAVVGCTGAGAGDVGAPGDSGGSGELSDEEFFAGGGLRVLGSYQGHESIAYGADWGWQGGGAADVVVSCSFYDRGLHVWSPRVA